MSLALEMSFNWLTGRMYIPETAPEQPKDIFGQTITVGSKVKFIGTVTSINLNEPHFNGIVVTPDYPPFVGLQGGLGVPMQAMSGPTPMQKPTVQYGFDPLQLVKVGTSL